MRRAAIVLSLALVVGACGCGPKNKYCPESGGPCYPPDDTTVDGSADGDGPEIGDADAADALDAGTEH